MATATKQMQLVDKVKLLTALGPRMTGDQFKVAHALILYFHNSKTGLCCPSLRNLGEISDVSVGTASAAVHTLRALGVVDFDPSNGGRNLRNYYAINLQVAERLIEEKFSQPNTNVQPAERGVQPAEHKRSASRNAYNNV